MCVCMLNYMTYLENITWNIRLQVQSFQPPHISKKNSAFLKNNLLIDVFIIPNEEIP